MSELLPKIQAFADRAAQIEERLADPAVASNPAEYAKFAKELSGLRPAAQAAAEYRKLLSEAALNRMYILRKVLAPLNPVDSMEFLLEKIKISDSNEEFLASMNS